MYWKENSKIGYTLAFVAQELQLLIVWQKCMVHEEIESEPGSIVNDKKSERNERPKLPLQRQRLL